MNIYKADGRSRTFFYYLIKITMETATATRTKWVIDPAHSEISFKVKHLMITNVKGGFKNFTGEALTEDDDPSSANVRLVIDTASIYTNDDKRDTHLRSADFFDVEHHEKIVFEGNSMEKIDNNEYKLTGILTIKGTSKQVRLDVEYGGINKDPWGNQKAGFSVKGKINRKDWGLTWNAMLETGGVLVSDEVKIEAEVQFIKETAGEK
jgi:polyisoprenoid-binding protein YceI